MFKKHGLYSFSLFSLQRMDSLVNTFLSKNNDNNSNDNVYINASLTQRQCERADASAADDASIDAAATISIAA